MMQISCQPWGSACLPSAFPKQPTAARSEADRRLLRSSAGAANAFKAQAVAEAKFNLSGRPLMLAGTRKSPVPYISVKYLHCILHMHTPILSSLWHSVEWLIVLQRQGESGRNLLPTGNFHDSDLLFMMMLVLLLQFSDTI